MENHELVCYCDNVTKGEILAAMENGAKEVKEVAKYITKSNEEDGVAYCIEELLKVMTNRKAGGHD